MFCHICHICHGRHSQVCHLCLVNNTFRHWKRYVYEMKAVNVEKHAWKKGTRLAPLTWFWWSAWDVCFWIIVENCDYLRMSNTWYTTICENINYSFLVTNSLIPSSLGGHLYDCFFVIPLWSRTGDNPTFWSNYLTKKQVEWRKLGTLSVNPRGYTGDPNTSFRYRLRSSMQSPPQQKTEKTARIISLYW